MQINMAHSLALKGRVKLLLVLLTTTMACDSYVEIDPPDDQLTGSLVYEDPRTVNAVFANIYSEMRENAFTAGNLSGLTYLLGHYADELDLYNPGFQSTQFFYDNNVLPTDSNIKTFWDVSYNLVYTVNSILEGVAQSESLSDEEADRFLGEAYFLRAFFHFHLANLFGEVPYIDSTDYRVNSQASKMEVAEVYARIIEDLQAAKTFLPAMGETRFRPDHWTARALLARVHLYQGDWAQALAEASQVISNGIFNLNPDINQTFLKDSPETIWQLDTGTEGVNTLEAFFFVFSSTPPPYSALKESLVAAFESGDSRLNAWVGTVTNGTDTWYFPNKYKESGVTPVTVECSILMRLSEQYLIAAEAQAHLGNTTEALEFLNAIRNRASLPPVGAMAQQAVLEAILQERKLEFFTEQGHRFFDLKRTGTLNAALSTVKPNWDDYKSQFPLPESELLLNPKLQPQNQGY